MNAEVPILLHIEAHGTHQGVETADGGIATWLAPRDPLRTSTRLALETSVHGGCLELQHVKWRSQSPNCLTMRDEGGVAERRSVSAFEGAIAPPEPLAKP